VSGAGRQYHHTPDRYLALMREAIPVYDAFQDAIADAGAGELAARVLDLGTGTGETARRVLARHPGARLVGVDASAEMLSIARGVVGPDAQLDQRRLEDPLPDGPFDLVVSALAVHHLDRAGKADLAARVRAVLAPAGRLVIGDVVVPDDPADAVTPLDRTVDLPERLPDLIAALRDGGLVATVSWAWKDLAVVVALSD
jgi:tRNA (cmo5U34)-methyltransferase